jgi:hypothetical protein
MPDNNCVPASDYTGYVADTVNLLLSLCPGNAAAPVGVGCRATDCTGAGTTTACTTCDVANNFYLLNGVCYAYASIPDGYGIVTAGQQALAACTDTNCLKCVDNKATCTRCKDALGYYMNTTVPLCQHISTVASGYGANLVSYNIVTCADTGCDDCKLDHTTCVTCASANGYYKNTTAVPTYCQLDSTIADTFGPDLVAKTIKACAKANCKRCRSDYLDCDFCDMANGYAFNTSQTLCVLTSSAADGYGPRISDSRLIQCFDTHCKDCRTNYLNCGACFVENGYYWNTTANYCQDPSTTADGYGPNTVTGNLEPCSKANCKECKNIYTTCTYCFTAQDYYLNSSGDCQHQSSITLGNGIDVANGMIKPCCLCNCELPTLQSRLLDLHGLRHRELLLLEHLART